MLLQDTLKQKYGFEKEEVPVAKIVKSKNDGHGAILAEYAKPEEETSEPLEETKWELPEPVTPEKKEVKEVKESKVQEELNSQDLDLAIGPEKDGFMDRNFYYMKIIALMGIGTYGIIATNDGDSLGTMAILFMLVMFMFPALFMRGKKYKSDRLPKDK